MSASYIRLLCLVACVAYVSAHYNNAIGSNGAAGVVGSAAGSTSGVEVVSADEIAAAKAAALTHIASAAAAAAKLDGGKWKEVDRYGWEQGKPLLVKPIDPLTPLYAAALHPRSFVAEIDPAFVKSPLDNVNGERRAIWHTGLRVGAVAV